MRKFFPAKPLERILVQRAGWNDQRPDPVDAELAGHRERKRLTHTVVVAKRLADRNPRGDIPGGALVQGISRRG